MIEWHSLNYVVDDALKREARKGLVEAEDLAIGDDFIVVTMDETEGEAVGDDMSLLDSTTKRAGPEIAAAADDLVIVGEAADVTVLLAAAVECIATFMTLCCCCCCCCCCILICCCSSAWTPLMELPGGMTILMRFGMPPEEDEAADPSIPPAP